MLDNQSRYLLDKISVLVVDDNQHMRSLVLGILHSLGVQDSCDAKEALDGFKKFQHFPADIIIVDWFMEPVDGLEFVKMVRTGEDSPNPYIPIIMLSAFSEYGHVIKARDSGVNEFLTKPISAKTLYGRIAAIIDRPRPFVKSDAYFGPCRRRRDIGPPAGQQERRSEDSQARTIDSPESNAAVA